MQEHTPVEIQIRKHEHQTVEKSIDEQSEKPKTLDELVNELYKVKDNLRDFPNWKKGEVRLKLVERKNLILLQIQKELSKVNILTADKVRKRLWEELGVVV